MSSSPFVPLETNNSQDTTTPSHDIPISILTIIVILSVTLLLSVSLCLLLRHLNGRCLRRLSPSSPAYSASPSPAAAASSNRVSPEDLSASSLLDSLPVFTYASIKRRSSSAGGDCAVCLSKFEAADSLRLLPLCCHAFHVDCIDTWLHSNQTCPLCRSPIYASEGELLAKALLLSEGGGSRSFRLEIGSVSRRRDQPDHRSSYSIGSFDYVVDEESEVPIHARIPAAAAAENKETAPAEGLAADVASGRSWLMDYVDRLSHSLSSRAMSFRGSGRFFTGSSRRSETFVVGDSDLEASRVGEEISEMFRWFSGV